MAVRETRTRPTRARGLADLFRRSRPVLPGVVTMLALLALPASALAQGSVKGEVSATVTADGFARLIFKMAEEVESEVRITNGIAVVAFKKPVDIAVDRVASGASDYIGGARRDPDGKAIRLALVRKVRVNTMAAGEQLFVDLLPEPWTGVVPGLPQDVVEELAKRARDAEKRALRELSIAQQRQQTLIRVRVGKQPTFTRYSFDLPRGVKVANSREDNQLTLAFDAPLRFDLADAQADQPESVRSIDSEADDESVSVRFKFVEKVDVRSFREEGSYVVDVNNTDKEEGEGAETERPKNSPKEQLKERLKESAAPKEAEHAAAAPAKPAPAAEKPAAAPKTADLPARPEAAPAQLTSATPVPPRVEQAAAPASPSPLKGMPPPGPLDDAPTLAGAAVAAPPAPAAAAAVASKPVSKVAAGAVVAQIMEGGDDLRVKFPFSTPTPAAVFRRADTLWVVFDTPREMDVQELNEDTTSTVRSVELTRFGESQALRIKLKRPRLASLVTEGAGWMLTVGDTMEAPSRPVVLARSLAGTARSTVIIPFEDARQVHRITDPDIGDNLFVITALGPARGVLKNQDFVEFRALASTHGVVLQPLADDLNAELAADKILVGRPSGLTLSNGTYGDRRSGASAIALDPQLWGFDKHANFLERQVLLTRLAAEATEQRRGAARLDLARFYLAKGLDAEAKAVLDMALPDGRLTADDVPILVLRGLSEIRLERPEDALKDLSNPLVGNQHDAPLWRAVAHTQQGKYAEAREGFRKVAAAIGTLPIELQQFALQKAMLAYIEVRDFANAETLLDEFDAIGVPHELEARMTLLTGRLAEGMGKRAEALSAYTTAAESPDRPAAAQARLREIALRLVTGGISRADAIDELEGLAVTWRGDRTELETLQLLAKLYTEESRFRDAFYTMRTAMRAHPNAEMTRLIHDEALMTFDSLFLGNKGEGMQTIDALSLFYDFRELTPIGRRGDEMIRRLADRLVGVDLLDQAAELLQYQIDHRLQGAARGQVATRLAVVYLMNRKADRALATLRTTRSSDFSNELRNQRLLIEARALSDMKRHDVALEVIANVPGREAIRLRSDILWGAQRWSQSAEQIELLYGARWQEWTPLADTERADLLRAAIGFALGDDTIGLTRFREKYATKMAEGPDGRAFDVVTAPAGTGGTEFRDVAKSVAAVDTLEGFLRVMRARFPDGGAPSGTAGQQPGKQTQAAPAPAAMQQAAR